MDMGFIRPFGLVLPLLTLAACGNPFGGYAPTQEQILTRGWTTPPASAEARGFIYCYRTLADADCYAAPEPGQENRLLSYNGDALGSPPR